MDAKISYRQDKSFLLLHYECGLKSFLLNRFMLHDAVANPRRMPLPACLSFLDHSPLFAVPEGKEYARRACDA
jgi:hypothetical protein